MGQQLKKIIRQDIQEMQAYHVAHVPSDCIKLDAMESPYDLPIELKEKLSIFLANAPLHLYPHIATDDLIPQIKQCFQVPEQADVVLGNGSDELIQLVSLLVAKAGAKIFSIEPTFVMYRMDAQLYHISYTSTDCHTDLSLDIEAVLQKIQEQQPDLIFIAYPNNPTGIRYPKKALQEIISKASGIVVIDEAYGAFSSDSFLEMTGEIKNLIVTKTFSKIGGAGIRLGFASGHPDVIQELKKITPPYNMNQLSIQAAKFFMTPECMQWINHNIDILKAEREIMFTELEDIESITVYPSETNFLTLRVPDAQYLFDVLLNNHYLVKNLHGVHPLLEQCIRITIGKPEDNKKIVTIIKKIYG